MVFVSLVAGDPHIGHVVLTHSGIFTKGLSPVPEGAYDVTSGSVSGNWSSGTLTIPHDGQWTRGIGSPQYRWRLNTQSLIL